MYGAQEKISIKCEGLWLSISPNLHDALCERRRRHCSGFLWADAICINQGDNQERAHKVRSMRDIYAKANRVIIWLGRGGPKDFEAFQLAKSLYQKCDGDRFDIDTHKLDTKNFDYKTMGAPRPSSPPWDALFTILSHPWFHRVWVVQERLVAQGSTMWRGALNLDTGIIL